MELQELILQSVPHLQSTPPIVNQLQEPVQSI